MRTTVLLSFLALGLTLTSAARADVVLPPTVDCGTKAGAMCTDDSDDANPGVCAEVDGTIQCRTACTGLGTTCGGANISNNCKGSVTSGSGVCVDEGGGTYCAPADTPCLSKSAGADCTLENGQAGTCQTKNPCGDGATLLCIPSPATSSGSGSCATPPASSRGSWPATAGLLGAAALSYAYGRRRAARRSGGR